MRSISLISVPLVLLLGGCGASGRTGGGGAVLGSAADERASSPAQAAIIALSEVEGVIYAEVPLGTRDRVHPGDFLRATTPDAEARLKATLQVSQSISPERSMARLIALFDRNAPLAVGDRVREVEDLGKLADPQATEAEARAEREKTTRKGKEQDDQFAALRDHYQKELARMQLEHQATVQSLEEQRARKLEEQTAAHRRELDRKEQERQADLAALRTTMSEQSRSAMRIELARAEEARQAVLAERTKLEEQVRVLVTGQDSLKNRITALIKEMSELDGKHREELRAEIETRGVLQARIAQMENQVKGIAQPLAPVLTGDPNRSETILDRMRRTVEERDLARREAEAAQIRIAELEREATGLRSTISARDVELRDIRQRYQAGMTTDKRLSEAETTAAALKEHTAALELAKLKAERSYFDLARRVLALGEDPVAWSELRTRLRQALAVDAPGPVVPASAGSNAQGKKP